MTLLLNRWIVYSTTILFLSGTSGCATTSVVPNWDELPKNQPIVVTTKSGDQIRLDHWTFERNGMLVGTFKWRGSAIPIESIAAIATIDESKQKLAETSFIVVGSVVGIVLVIYVVGALHFPFGV